MKIRTQLIAGIVVFALLLVTISAFVMITDQQLDALAVRENAANNIALEAGELGDLSNNYILYRQPVQAEQWNTKFALISGDVANLSVDQPNQQAIVAEFASNLNNTRSVFNDIASSTILPGGTTTSYIQISESRMAIQNQETIFNANQLSDLINTQENNVRLIRFYFVFAILGAFGVLMLNGYFLFYRRTLKSIANIQAGTRIIGSGYLDYEIIVDSDDEIADLSRSFNRMTSELKNVIATKSDLEREIAGRKQAEVNLLKKNDDLNVLNEELTSTQEELHQNLEELSLREQELVKSEAELKEALTEKEVLLSEIHHRVKNNLTAFISLLSLDGSYEDTEAGQTLRKDLQNRARSMALIHETLYRTGKFSKVDMGIYLKNLVDQIAQSYNTRSDVHVAVNVSGTLSIDRATTAGLIINELVTNSFKYAFPPGFDCMAVRGAPCTIRVSLANEDGLDVLRVSDNGCGFREGFDPLSSKSLGLKLVNFLSRHQLMADIEVRSDRGTEFIFRLKNIESHA